MKISVLCLLIRIAEVDGLLGDYKLRSCIQPNWEALLREWKPWGSGRVAAPTLQPRTSNQAWLYGTPSLTTSGFKGTQPASPSLPLRLPNLSGLLSPSFAKSPESRGVAFAPG